MALRDGLLAVPSPTQQRLMVEGDSKILIDTLNGAIVTPWRIKFLVLDILHLTSQFLNISFHHIYREVNFVADSLANLGHSSSSSLSWNGCLPLSSGSAFQLDQFGGGCPRDFCL